jgi:pimeloyl-ACP methyl ester carboxylesterase
VRRAPQALDAKARVSAPGQFAELPEGMVHYELAGSTDAQPVVLISGLSVPCSSWDPTFKALMEAGFRVLRYDLYGRGVSDRPDISYDQGLFDRQLGNLLGALGVGERVDLVGWSMGGAISVVFADRHPESVRRLCLIDPAGLPWQQSPTPRLAAAPVLGEWIMSLLGAKMLVSRLHSYCYRPAGHDEFVRALQIQMQYAGFKRALLSTLRSGVTTGAVEAYRRVGQRNVPAMLVWGREDRVVPFELNKRVQELIPHIEFHPIDAAAHTPHYERPQDVNPLLIDFLSR